MKHRVLDIFGLLVLFGVVTIKETIWKSFKVITCIHSDRLFTPLVGALLILNVHLYLFGRNGF